MNTERCRNCQVGVIPRGQYPIPTGYKRKGCRGLCSSCYRRLLISEKEFRAYEWGYGNGYEDASSSRGKWGQVVTPEHQNPYLWEL